MSESFSNTPSSSNVLQPFCGTYSFSGNSYLFNCQSTVALVQEVEFLNDFYITAIGSTLAPQPTTNPFGFTASASLASFDSLLSAATSSPTASTSDVSSTSTHSGLSIVAIDGIIAAGVIIGVAILAIIVVCFICARRRRDRRAAQPPPAYRQQPMQQQDQRQEPQKLQKAQPESPPQSTPQPLSKAFGGYQSVPQQEQRSGVIELHNSVPRTPELSSPLPTQTAFLSPSSSVSAPTLDPRFSSAATTLRSPVSPGSDQRQSYFKPSVSPTISEKDATMGNPRVPLDAIHGVPAEVDATRGNPGVPVTATHGIPTEVDATTGNPGVPVTAAHGVPAEVDATTGNPGMPLGQHGMLHQATPAGRPNATELDGTMSWAGGGMHLPASSTQQRVELPAEMGHHWRE